MSMYYFAEDGSYGEAEGLVIVDTTLWTEEMWEVVSTTCESDRLEVLLQLDDVVIEPRLVPMPSPSNQLTLDIVWEV